MTHGDSAMHHTSSFRHTLSGAVFAASMMIAGPAVAHWGHLGDLAGHGHLAGAVLAGAAAVLAAGLIATCGNSDNKDNDIAADDADDASSAHADGDSTANPASASCIMIVDPEHQRPAIKAFSTGVRAHG